VTVDFWIGLFLGFMACTLLFALVYAFWGDR
jgi:hypothetical protein